MTVTKTFGDKLWNGLRILGWLGVAAILVAPAVAMRFTTEVQWTETDFAFAAILLIGGGGITEMFAMAVKNPVARICFALVVVAIVTVIWGMSI